MALGPRLLRLASLLLHVLGVLRLLGFFKFLCSSHGFGAVGGGRVLLLELEVSSGLELLGVVGYKLAKLLAL